MAEVTWAVTLGDRMFELNLRPTDEPGVYALTVTEPDEVTDPILVSLHHVYGGKYLITLGKRTW